MILIGYSGHAFVAAGILYLMEKPVTSYCDEEEKSYNPLHISYLGSEKNPSVSSKILSGDFFIAVGDNSIRQKIALRLEKQGKYPVSIIHPSAIVDRSASISEKGVMISSGVCINPFSKIMDGAILNTSSVIEHECVVGAFAHIGPGAVLCGNVKVGDGSFVGAGAIVRQNINIGKNVIIGAGSVVVKDVDDNECVVGIPSKKIDKKR